MRILHLSIGIVVLILLMISGCISGNVTEGPEADVVQSTVAPQVTETEEEEPVAEEIQTQSVPLGFTATVTEIVTEREVYHSNEVMEFTVTVELAQGEGQAYYFTSDLTYDYVKINADYRT